MYYVTEAACGEELMVFREDVFLSSVMASWFLRWEGQNGKSSCVLMTINIDLQLFVLWTYQFVVPDVTSEFRGPTMLTLPQI